MASYSSLPTDISAEIRSGEKLAGDDYSPEQLRTWYAQEENAFASQDFDHGLTDTDPWYAYIRHVNWRLAFPDLIKSLEQGAGSLLVLGPGSGKEVEKLYRSYPHVKLHFIEPAESYWPRLRESYPGCEVHKPSIEGNIPLPANSIDAAIAFSVLHHIANVSHVISEISRVLRPGGIFAVREPCSSMGDWRYPRSSTPNERGISKTFMLHAARRAGLEVMPGRSPVPVLWEPINKIVKRIGFDGKISYSLIYAFDRLISRLLSPNDWYWRDSFAKKLAPSSYMFLFQKTKSS